MSSVRKYTISFCLYFIVSVASAADVNYSVGIILSKYDNIDHVRVPEESETSQSILGQISATENTVNLVANLDASLEVIDYKNNQAQDENTGTLDANALWIISPNQYELYVSDIYTQALIDSFGTDTPDNRQNANAFAIGPNLFWRINSNNNLNLQARIELITFERLENVDNSDNDRIKIDSSWDYQLKSTTTFSFNYVVESVDYDNEISNTDYDRNDVFLALNYQRNMNVFDFEIGATHIDNNNEADFDESRFSLSILNTRTRTSTLRLDLNRNLTDASSELLDLVEDQLSDVDDEVNAVDIYLDKTASITYNQNLVSGSLSININKSISDYQRLNQLDETEKGALLTGTWNIQPLSQFSLTAEYTNIVFDNVSREDDEYLYTLFYAYNARRHITVGFEVTAQERLSSDFASVYDDFRMILSFTYRNQ